jgi:hypothetical protein
MKTIEARGRAIDKGVSLGREPVKESSGTTERRMRWIRWVAPGKAMPALGVALLCRSLHERA